MNFFYFKKINPIYLYLVSIISFVLANIFRDNNNSLYIFLLTIGVSFFIWGFIIRIKNR